MLTLLLLGISSIYAQDQSDHPLITSYPESRIATHHQVEFEPYEVVVGLNPGSARRLNLEGRITRIRYTNPTGRSPYEIFKNYEGAMKQAGAEVLYRRDPKTPGTWPTYHEQKLTNMGGQSIYAMVGRVTHGGAEAHVVIAVSSYATWIHVIESKAMQTGLVVVDARAMEEALSRDGRIELNTIEFDTASAVIKPESKSTISEIAKLLTNRPELNLDIVGHTDDTGTVAGNLRLSADRAKSIVTDLVSSFGIDIKRLRGLGMGQSKPVAENTTEEGKKKNRRVELVAQK